MIYHCLLALTPDMSEEDKQATLEVGCHGYRAVSAELNRVVQADWLSDSKGRGGLTFKMFHMSLYQLTGVKRLAWFTYTCIGPLTAA